MLPLLTLANGKDGKPLPLLDNRCMFDDGADGSDMIGNDENDGGSKPPLLLLLLLPLLLELLPLACVLVVVRLDGGIAVRPDTMGLIFLLPSDIASDGGDGNGDGNGERIDDGVAAPLVLPLDGVLMVGEVCSATDKCSRKISSTVRSTAGAPSVTGNNGDVQNEVIYNHEQIIYLSYGYTSVISRKWSDSLLARIVH